ncbi:MAG: methylmalonyl-CoA mutase family protein [candidate division Zixibacteria bacterium]|nr:methylmalonyl-CoA mutase family protein [candidate division Zixibacteria bacterium]
MFDKSFLEELRERRRQWDAEKDKFAQNARPRYMTVSGDDVDILYGPESVDQSGYLDKIGFPGQYPYTRGVHHSMYRGRMWTMRQFSGMGTARQTNERYHYLLKQGQTGLSVAFDLPTLMGYDSDHQRSMGEICKCGVAVDTLADMEIIFDGIDLSKISTSMTINAPASILLAMYVAVGEKQGIASHKLTGTLQNDILKEYIAQKEWVFPPEPSIRLITDLMDFCARHIPKWNTISISGYHIREAGATAAQELAFTLADGFQYVESAIAAGQDVDVFAPRLSFFFNAHQDFFEEIAKYRAARRIWARHMREKYGAKKEESWKLRFHTQTAGCSLTAQQPENNLMRTAYEALSGVLGGTQSLHTNSMDETLALPSDKAVLLALRTQQIIMHETGVANTIDPLAGSYYVEYLTDKLEAEAEAYFTEIERRGGVLKGIEEGFFQREIAKSAYRYQKEIEREERIIVGVNGYVMDEEITIPVLRIDETVARDQVASLQKIKQSRDNDKVKRTLEELAVCARGNGNTLQAILDCVRVYATEGEIVDTLRPIFGEYQEPPMF